MYEPGGEILAERAISVNNVQMAYGSTAVLKGVSLSVGKGEVLAVIGPSGSGKSTLLRMLIGLSRPTGGNIFINGQQVENFSEEEWNRLRKSMGMVFQYSALFDSMTVGENVAFGLRQHTGKGNAEILSIVEKTLDTVGLSGYSGYMPGQLSGGMKKRVSLARAIATNPEILLYDEPTAGLDPVVADVINNLMLETKKRLKVTSGLVTHDMYSAFMVADRIAMIHEGLIVAEGAPAEILKCEHEIVKTFIHKAMPPGGTLYEQ
jgi:phospholipid/cholesterol/gamma-HCH transport system ATP-binding protein